MNIRELNTSIQRADPNLRTYVRILDPDKNGFVEFLFGIGSSDLMVELILPRDAFREFCHANAVIFLSEKEAEKQDADLAKWQYGEPGVHD